MKQISFLLTIFLVVIILSLVFWNNKVTDFFDPILNPDNSASSEASKNSSVSTSKIDATYPYFFDEEDLIYIIFVEGDFELAYDRDVEDNFLDASTDLNFTSAINGGYFLEDKTPAGLFWHNGELISQLAERDNQLTHIVGINSDRNVEIFSKNHDLSSYSNYKTLFQTGPLIINENSVQTNFINNSANGSGEYLRSFLGITESGKTFIGIVNSRISLNELAEKLLNYDILKGEVITVVNLDGGSSIALFSKDNKDFRLGTYKRLPLILGARAN